MSDFRSKFNDRGAWLVPLFLAIGVLLPTAGVLWFMNEAARSQYQAARQILQEAYRGQLRLLRDRLDANWQARAAALQQAAQDGTPSHFPAALAASGADAVLFLNASGAVQVPVPLAASRPDTLEFMPEWQAIEELEQRGGNRAAAVAYTRIAANQKSSGPGARAARAAVRCLVKAGLKEEALSAIATYFINGRTASGRDLDGRLIALDEQLLALHLMSPADRRFAPAAERLAGLLNHYEGDPIPSAQRVFVLSELSSLAPTVGASRWLAAEKLGLAFLESERARPGLPVLASSGMADVWTLTSPNRRVIAVFRTPTVVAIGQRLLAEQNSSPAVAFSIAPPGSTDTAEAIAAGPALPGWQIGFSLRNQKAFEEASRQKAATYVWIAYIVIAGIAVVAVMLALSFRRQSRLARMKTDLVATVSHELKTPLASMRLLVETLLEDPNVQPQTAREYLELISGENQRLTRLIDNFLTFSRMERSRQRFAFRETDPSDVVETALRSVRDRMQPPECCLEVAVDPGLPPVRADRDALVTVLLNLLDNAWKYTRGEKHLAVRAYASGGNVVFAVKDNGIGIAASEQRRIFRRFYQVDRRLARESGGCGLGLSIVDFIVRAHGGEVQVQSVLGSGSTFSVVVPSIPIAREVSA
jgi:two-component system, OmpR family, phosphate regulon sensor histidine kinase PhoR